MNSKKIDYAYVTALTTKEYIPGCMALARSLMEVNSEYKLIILIPESVENDLMNGLIQYGLHKVCGDYAEVIAKPDIFLPSFKDYAVDMKYSFWQYSFFKLQVASLYEYKKVILLDCDQMAVRNIDHLFEKPHMTATTCGRCIHPDWKDLSAGLVVIEPSERYYHQLLDLIEPAAKKKYEAGLQAGDQDVFNAYIPDWRDRADLYIPEKYNICWGMIEALCRSERVSVKDFYMIHFPGRDKPWNRPRYYHFWILIYYLIKGKFDKLLFKVKMYGKYRKLCCPKR